MSVVDNAVNRALQIANDDSHGYSQVNRWGPDYDCSSFLITVWQDVGVPVKTAGATYTGNMLNAFKSCGFREVNTALEPLIAGDVLLNVVNHTAMYIGNNRLVQATSSEHGTTDGDPGDQTGLEISTGAYYDYPWDYVLRYAVASTWISGNYYLGLSDMQNNAILVANWGYEHGWTKNAISAILGNMQAESSINPGIWESLNPYGGGYGLVQWTPYTKYSDWATAQGYSWENNGDAEMLRIAYEAQNNLQWFYNSQIGMAPPITFAEFLVSDLPINTLSNYWLWFYEHPADPYESTQALRQQYTQYWYNYIPDGPTTQFPIWLLFQFDKWRWFK